MFQSFVKHFTHAPRTYILLVFNVSRGGIFQKKTTATKPPLAGLNKRVVVHHIYVLTVWLCATFLLPGSTRN